MTHHQTVSGKWILRALALLAPLLAVLIAVSTPHRAEAFALAGAFMDRLKQDVPIWKVRAIPV